MTKGERWKRDVDIKSLKAAFTKNTQCYAPDCVNRMCVYFVIYNIKMKTKGDPEMMPLTENDDSGCDDTIFNDQQPLSRPKNVEIRICDDKTEKPSINDMKISLMACVRIFSLGTLWRFPYVCLKYGGGTFLIPYTITMFLVGYPLLVMEIGIGQKLRHNSFTVWTAINPQLRGISVVMCMISAGMICYYSIILSWGYKYMFDINLSRESLTPYGLIPIDSIRIQTFWHKTVLNVTSSITDSNDVQEGQVFSQVITWMAITTLLVTLWISLKFRSIRSFVVLWDVWYQSIPFFIQCFIYIFLPVLLLVMYVVRSGYGYVSFIYITSIEFKDLSNLQIWVDAIVQVIFTLSLVHGSWISYGSRSSRSSNYLLTATTVIAYSFFVVFSWTLVITCSIIPTVLQEVKNCVISSAYKWDNSPGMPSHIFYGEDYNAAIASRKLDNTLVNFDVQECSMENQFNLASNGMGIVFVALGGISSIFHAVSKCEICIFVNNICLSFILNLWLYWLVYLLKWHVHALTEVEFFKKTPKTWITLITCVTCCTCSLLFATRTGVYWLSLISSISINSCISVLALCEVLIVIYIYGYKQFLLDIYEVTGYMNSRLTYFIWKYITPCVLILTLSSILTIGVMDGYRYDIWTYRSNFLTKSTYPYWTQLIAWAISTVFLLLILVFCLVNMKKEKKFGIFKSLEVKVKKNSNSHKQQLGYSPNKPFTMDIDLDDCSFDSYMDDGTEITGVVQAPSQMYKIEVLDSWKSIRGQVYL
ncbi:sodium- and chloride-dependent transporter XTRP3A-like [Daktulosphaira vitifoliae]|uniref:sodium- and chloride-dependent transporter XTRP3A-like n=1 Tax=Daktulosphaira vitifoliae TaxID=58002 RepID=UPI0021A97A42|nr:sodium- and chloride-dependent transporter XTRP3A-like [Daktulosphaira vitifoliae]